MFTRLSRKIYRPKTLYPLESAPFIRKITCYQKMDTHEPSSDTKEINVFRT